MANPSVVRRRRKSRPIYRPTDLEHLVQTAAITYIYNTGRHSSLHSVPIKNDWHSEECKLTPTLTFDLLTSNKMDDQDLSCTIHLPSLMMLCPVVFVLEC